MKIFGFGALNLDLIYEVDDLRSVSAKRGRLAFVAPLFAASRKFCVELLNGVGD